MLSPLYPGAIAVMKQVIQNYRSGRLSLAEVPDPLVQPGKVLIANVRSLISAGTEKMALELGRKSLLGKARERPDQVARLVQKIRTEGLKSSIAQAFDKLDQPMALGYSSSGIVLACGDGVQDFRPGERVASNGPHAGIVCVPKHLCAHVPDGVSHDEAAFAVLGAIALQGLRLSRVSLGETVFVIGLGLIGQLTVALFRAAGCRVLGMDPDPERCELSRRMGAEDASPGLDADRVLRLTGDQGADAVVITASTPSSGPVALAAECVRKRGRIVAVGAVGLELPRRPFYFKEAELVVSCSYGPGRYDPLYEERGQDYPFGHVRWTEQRNLQAVLETMAGGKLDVSPLISHRFPIDRAGEAYSLMDSGQPFLGILLEYADAGEQACPVMELKAGEGPGELGVGVVGAGNFARAVLLPSLSRLPGLRLRTLVSAGGLSASHTGDRHGFERVATSEDELFRDSAIRAVFVLTRHGDHAGQVCAGLAAGKHVFVEKPLAVDLAQMAELDALLERMSGDPTLLLVGFNRRFSPLARFVRRHFAGVDEPLTASIRFNAGKIPPDHWTQDDLTGGGRIIGEACHGIDLMTYLVGSPPVRVYAECIGGPRAPEITDDQCFITLRHACGSISSVAYLAGGDRAYAKERVEVLGGGRLAVIDDFQEAVAYRDGKKTRERSAGQDKGHRDEVAAFVEAVRSGGASPIPWPELRAVSYASILAVRSLREGVPFDIPA